MGWTGGVAILLALSSGAAMLPQVGNIFRNSKLFIMKA